jgi:hypothetical protein
MPGGAAERTTAFAALVLLRRVATLAALCVLFSIRPVQAFDHTHADWTALLARHVSLLDEGRASRLSYAGMARDRARLRAYLDALSVVTEAEFAAWPRARRLAFLLNAYNAFTVEKVLTRHPGLSSIRDFGRVFGNPWKDRFFRLLGRPESLDGIEHGLIRAPGAYDEPRIHFAANCASIGCPMLREEAYVAERLDAQLEDQVRRFLSDRSRNRVSGGVLEISRIFDWYGDDFAAGGGVQVWLAARAGWLSDVEAERAALRAGRLRIAYLPYDWALNDAP